jgi:hypothetical protein
VVEKGKWKVAFLSVEPHSNLSFLKTLCVSYFRSLSEASFVEGAGSPANRPKLNVAKDAKDLRGGHSNGKTNDRCIKIFASHLLLSPHFDF